MLNEFIIRNKLINLADGEYKEFQRNLCPSMKKEMLGVRIPILRRYAKELLKQEEAEELLDIVGNQYYEEIMLQGMLIGLNTQKDIEKIKGQIKKFVPKIDNWAVCDTFCSGLKITKKHKETMWNFIQQYLESNNEFDIRFGVVMILDYYIEEKYLNQIFEKFDKIYENSRKNQYYVQMAVAWAITECLTKFYNETKQYLKVAEMDIFTYNKAIQKACESLRITSEQKEDIKKIKKFEK